VVRVGGDDFGSGVGYALCLGVFVFGKRRSTRRVKIDDDVDDERQRRRIM
jgi:hypothetical protein